VSLNYFSNQKSAIEISCLIFLLDLSTIKSHLTMMNFKKLLLVIAAFCPLISMADVRLPKMISSNMVLQRNTKLTIWGWADPGENVTVKLGKDSYSAQADQKGKWSVEIPTQSFNSEPSQIEIQGKNTIKLENILFGDVWLCSGQSNMEWNATMGINNAAAEIAAANYPQIRFITAINEMKKYQANDILSEGWKVCTPENMKQFSSVGYFFGRELYNKYKVPIGLISADWGGSPIESWMSFDALKKFDTYKQSVIESEAEVANPEEFERQSQAKIADWILAVNKLDKGLYPNGKSWASSDFDTKDWIVTTVPGAWEKTALPDFDGVAWLRKTIDLPASMVGKDLTLSLSTIDDNDITYFNGEVIGSVNGYNMPRVYTVPASKVKAGKNTIAVRVFDTRGGGGICGNAEYVFLSSGKDTLSLVGDWLINPSVAIKDMPSYPLASNNWSPMATMYNGMVFPIIKFAIKGTIWYQGEANAGEHSKYNKLLTGMIEQWRKDFNNPEMPFLYVQLAGFWANSPNATWPYLREAQLKTLSVPNTGMAVAIDLGDSTNIHPQNKQDVGKRLALVAMKVAYKDNVQASGPMYQGMASMGDQLAVRFTEIGSGLITKDGKALRGFEIAGSDRKFYPAKATITGNKIILENENVHNPVVIRYDWDNFPKGNLYNKEGLPASPFRTDNW
jgi:sialate O-acetylesterase